MSIKCPICTDKFNEIEDLHNHLETEHYESIPKNFTAAQYYYALKTGKYRGTCIICKSPTIFNTVTGKYNRFCDISSHKCKEKYREIFKQRMIGKYGKIHLLNSPNQQKKMLANRSISGTYIWNDGAKKTYTGSYELDFLKFLDIFMDFDSEDVMSPSPHTYFYIYNNEKKFYIPDVFIPSLNLEIEIKDGGDNPNKHHKIQKIDKVKEKLKDEILMSQNKFSYIKIVNKKYEPFFEFLNKIKQNYIAMKNPEEIKPIFIVREGLFSKFHKTEKDDSIEHQDYVNNYLNKFKSEHKRLVSKTREFIRLDKYKTISKAIMIDRHSIEKEDIEDGSQNWIVIFDWDLWKYNHSARGTDDINIKKNKLFYDLIDELKSDIRNELKDTENFKIDSDSDWDTGSVELKFKRKVNKPVNEKLENILESTSTTIKKIINTASEHDVNKLGPRNFYNRSKFKYVHLVKNEEVGFIEVRTKFSYAFINLFIKEEFRGKGYSNILIKKALEFCKSNKSIKQISWTTSKDNKASIHLAKKYKFEEYITTKTKKGNIRFILDLKKTSVKKFNTTVLEGIMYTALVRVTNHTLNQPHNVMIDLRSSFVQIRKMCNAAKTIQEIDEALRILNKNLSLIKRNKNYKLKHGNTIPILDRKVKEPLIDKYIHEMELLQEELLRKKQTLKDEYKVNKESLYATNELINESTTKLYELKKLYPAVVVYAKEDIPKGTSLGISYVYKKNSGNFFKDFKLSDIAYCIEYVKQGNLDLVPVNNDIETYEFISNKHIKKGKKINVSFSDYVKYFGDRYDWFSESSGYNKAPIEEKIIAEKFQLEDIFKNEAILSNIKPSIIQESSTFEVKDSKIAGKGIFAKTSIPSGRLIGVAMIKEKNTGNPDKDFTRTNLGKFVNHSNNPNLTIEKHGDIYYYRSIKFIDRGTEMTVNYKDFDFEGERSFVNESFLNKKNIPKEYYQVIYNLSNKLKNGLGSNYKLSFTHSHLLKKDVDPFNINELLNSNITNFMIRIEGEYENYTNENKHISLYRLLINKILNIIKNSNFILKYHDEFIIAELVHNKYKYIECSIHQEDIPLTIYIYFNEKEYLNENVSINK